MIRRGLAVAATLMALVALTASPAVAHPLGNATVNRATAVTIGQDRIEVVHVIDMAEIPAYAAILEIDLDRNGEIDSDERASWATAACEDAVATLTVTADGRLVALHPASSPALSFPPGVGGLETLRLVCTTSGPLPRDGAEHTVTVSDGADPGRRGWREVTIAAVLGVTLRGADVPAVSPSGLLTAYPEDLLQAPIAVAAGSAAYRSAPATAGTPEPNEQAAAPTEGSGARPADALVGLLDSGAAPWSWLVAVAVAAGLGAAHAVSPGHGKALIAAYVIGSRGSMRRAAGLGLTVAISHTIGVFILGLIVLSATELLVPDRVVAWLSVASGILVVGLGASVARRAWRSRHGAARDEHPHPHPHPHTHEHSDEHGHDHAEPPAAREFLTLGLVGGMVPSTSALLVLLVAVATGRLVEGLLLIAAFGLGMAVVLGGLAAITALARNGLADAAGKPGASGLRRLAGAAPLASALVIIVVGVATTVGALGSL